MPDKLVAAFLIFTLLAFGQPVKAEVKNDSLGETELYTRINIWHEQSTIPSTNYHLGEMIPAGTKVKITSMWDGQFSEISFLVDGQREEFHIRIRSSVTKLPVLKVRDRYFSKTDPLAEGGEFSKFTPEEQKNIKKGVIEKGMSKDAVIMAYGYPPAHKTPSLEGNRWLYWKALKQVVLVEFEGDKVVAVGANSSTKVYRGKED